MKLGKIIGKAARIVRDNPGKVKIVAGVVGLVLPPVVTKVLDVAEAVKRK